MSVLRSTCQREQVLEIIRTDDTRRCGVAPALCVSPAGLALALLDESPLLVVLPELLVSRPAEDCPPPLALPLVAPPPLDELLAIMPVTST